MSHYYVACEIGLGTSRVLVGTLHQERLTISELRRFSNVPLKEKDSFLWNIPKLYREIIEGLRSAGSYEEPVDSISCTSWGGDYLLFEKDGSLITPAYYRGDSLSIAGARPKFPKISADQIYDETGIPSRSTNTLFQLLEDSSRRLKQAAHLLPVADGFNFLLSGVPRVEMSQASSSQLFNPQTKEWSQRLATALHLPPALLSPLVPAGTDLGPVLPELSRGSSLTEARVIASCSHQLAAVLTGLPLRQGENWLFIRPGKWTIIGTEVSKPIISPASGERNFYNQVGHGDSVAFFRQDPGLWILEECQRHWEGEGRPIDGDLLGHLAGSSTPFESLINPTDSRFQTPGDMPLKIQAFCKDTNQVVPRKPGPIFRCILESLAFQYRQSFEDLKALTGEEYDRIYIVGGSANMLLNHFIANALQLPVTIVSPDSGAIGNVIVQAMTLGHLSSLEQARETVRRSFKTETIIPQSSAWNAAFERLAGIFATPTPVAA